MIVWLLRRTPKISIPAHAHCATALKRRLFWPRIGTFIIATAAAIICAASGLSKLTAVLAFIVAAAPFIIGDLLWPPPLDLSGTDTEIEFEFRDADYAAEFARLNGIEPEKA